MLLLLPHRRHSLTWLLSLCRYLFYDWDVLSEKKDHLSWRTNCPLRISDLFSLELLKTVKGYGSVKLLNARLSKPAETAMLAMPPCTASLKTSPAGDRMLIITVHMAIISQVCRSHCPIMSVLR